MNRGKVQSILNDRAHKTRIAWVHAPLDLSENETRVLHNSCIRTSKAALKYRQESDKIVSKMVDPKGKFNAA